MNFSLNNINGEKQLPKDTFKDLVKDSGTL